MHPSLLPKLRGACPIQWQIIQNHKEAGASLISISKNKFDAGNIIFQEKLDSFNAFDENYRTLAEKLSILGGNMIAKSIENKLQDQIIIGEE